DEQLHIVKLLTKIDEMIETQSKIIEEYVILKNSLIHRFFTMDNPKVKLSTILTEINIKNKNKQIDTVLSVSNKLGFIKQSEQFEDREVASDDTSNYKIVNKGDYAYNPARINVGSIARLINYDKGIISPMYSCFKINEKKITYTYFDMFLSSFSFKRQLNKKLEGSVRQCLTFEGMLSMDIELPCIETQKSISNKIDMLNYKIKLESDYREALIKQKQFLLNNMFI
ncbi:restriction endonuclease subunit S, partial [uncultured Holdemanella sp.]|uniref:restriction endonuclease subunit S n=1 Tax=uncultured Holdemanella sp. TaxID=1763549 RepID=UPI002805509C